MHRTIVFIVPVQHVRVAFPGRIDAISDGKEQSRGACSRARCCHHRHTAVAKVISWEGKARATAEGVLFRPLASAVAPYMPAQGVSEE